MSDSEVNGQGAGAPPVEPTAQAPVSPGAKLAAFRGERGWTVEQVASQLNLAPRQIVAIENDDYAALPGMPIVRGFIRAYAKLLKVDAAPLMAALDAQSAPANEEIVPRKSLSTPFSDARIPSMTHRPGLSSKWIVGVLVALLLGVAIWASQQRGSGAGAPAPSPQAQEDAAGAPQEAQAPTGTVDEVLPVPPLDPNAGGNVAPDAGVSQPAAPASNASAAPSAGQAPVAAQPAPMPAANAQAGANTLRLTAREESWVEVRRASNNSVLVSRIVKAGETASVEVTEPVSLVIGNAAGVDASLRGVPVELKPGTKSNVARVNLK